MLLISVLFSATSFAKDLHFIYVRFDRSMDTEKLKTQIEKLIDSISDSDFIVYYSNENTTMDMRSWDKNKLFGQIIRQNSSIDIDSPDEIESISVLLENQLQEALYDSIYFECFVGNDFFNKEDYQNKVLAKMLIVNSLLQSKYRVSLHYYPCGATYKQTKIKFNPEYNINVSPKIISSI